MSCLSPKNTLLEERPTFSLYLKQDFYKAEWDSLLTKECHNPQVATLHNPGDVTILTPNGVQCIGFNGDTNGMVAHLDAAFKKCFLAGCGGSLLTWQFLLGGVGLF